MRQIVLDTETTGLEVSQDHRIIEIGCVELINRKLTGRTYHQYLNPMRKIDEGAIAVHGITNEFLDDKPTFEAVSGGFLEFLNDSELVIHNAPFDIGFLDYELKLSGSGQGKMANICAILDSLVLAREKHPGQRNNLDALCKRYGVDNTQRDLHGALLDAEILADVYLLMTSGQSSLSLREEQEERTVAARRDRKFDPNRPPLRIVAATADELESHEACLNEIDEASDGGSLWRRLDKA